MLKQIAVTATILSFLLAPTVALAENDSQNESIEKRTEIRSAVQEKRQEIRSNVEEKREEIKTKIEDKKEEIKLKFNEKRTEAGKKIIERQTKHADNLNSIIVRLQTRIDTLNTDGKDTATAQTELDKAKTSLAEVFISITNSSDILNTITTDNITTEFPKLKSAIRNTHQQLVLTQQNIRKAINEAKKISDPGQKDDTERSKGTQ